MRKTILIIILSIAVTGSILFWILRSGVEITGREILMLAAAFLVVAFALFMAFRRLADAKSDQPPEDELSRAIQRKGAATSFHVSIVAWLVIMGLADKTSLECHSLIGAGILAMAVIYAVSWLYHRYLGRKHE
jgi:anaerobic C4-dicarboxylate transporter